MIPGVLRRHAATLAAIAGAGSFAAALGGLTTIDDDLRAAVPAAPAQTQTVDDRRDGDCPLRQEA